MLLKLCVLTARRFGVQIKVIQCTLKDNTAENSTAIAVLDTAQVRACVLRCCAVIAVQHSVVVAGLRGDAAAAYRGQSALD